MSASLFGNFGNADTDLVDSFNNNITEARISTFLKGESGE